MDRDEYQALKESGGLAQDAVEQEETEVIEEKETITEPIIEADEVGTEILDEEEIEPLTPKEQTAFEKRLDREQKKISEKVKAEMEEQYKQKYSKHDELVSSLGGQSVDALLEAAKEQRLVAEINRKSRENGWTQEEAEYHYEQEKQKIEQQKTQQELKTLRVQMQINNLRDKPEYAGITSMENEILAKIDKSNGALSVEEAYWAMGGAKKAEQIKLESQMREQVKRAQIPRTVLTDAPVNNTAEKPLPPDVLREAERMGITASEARRLMNRSEINNLDDYRKMKNK